MSPAREPRPAAELGGGVGTLARLDAHTLLESRSAESAVRAARDIHDYGRRAEHPALTFSAAALRTGSCAPSPEEVLLGLFDRAGSGTLVITGIEDAAVEIQMLLLDEIEQRHKAGAPSPRLIVTSSDARKVAADLRSRLAYLFIK